MNCDFDTSVLSIATSLIGKDCAAVHFTLPDKVLTKRKKRWDSLIKKYEQLATETKDPEELYIDTLEKVSSSNLSSGKTLQEGSWEDRPMYIKTRASVQRWINSQLNIREMEAHEKYPPLEQEKLATDAPNIEFKKILTNSAKNAFVQKVNLSVNSENSESVNSENLVLQKEELQPMRTANLESVKEQISGLNLTPPKEGILSAYNRNREFTNNLVLENCNICSQYEEEKPLFIDKEKLETTKNQVSGKNMMNTDLQKENLLFVHKENSKATEKQILENHVMNTLSQKEEICAGKEATKNQVSEKNVMNTDLQKEKLLSAQKENPETIEKQILENDVVDPLPQKEEICISKEKRETSENQDLKHHIINTVLQEKKLMCADKENLRTTRNPILEKTMNPVLQKEEILCIGKENKEFPKAQIMENRVLNLVLQKEEILCADENDQGIAKENLEDHVMNPILHTGTENLRTTKKNDLNYKMNDALGKNNHLVMEVILMRDHSLIPIIKLEKCDDITLARKEKPMINVTASENLSLKKPIVQDCLSDDDCVQSSMGDVSTVILHPLLSCETEKMIPCMRTRLKSFHYNAPALSDSEHDGEDLVVDKGIEENTDILDNSKAIEGLCNNTARREVTEETSFTGSKVATLATNMLTNIERNINGESCNQQKTLKKTNITITENAASATVEGDIDISETKSCHKQKTNHSHYSKYNEKGILREIFDENNDNVQETLTPNNTRKAATVNMSFSSKGNISSSEVKSFSKQEKQKSSHSYSCNDNISFDDIFNKRNLKIEDVLIGNGITKSLNGNAISSSGKDDTGSSKVELFSKRKRRKSSHSGSYNENVLFDDMFNKRNLKIEDVPIVNGITESLNGNIVSTSGKDDIDSSEIESFTNRKRQKSSHINSYNENILFDDIFNKHYMRIEDVLITNDRTESLNENAMSAIGKDDIDSSKTEPISKQTPQKCSYFDSYNDFSCVNVSGSKNERGNASTEDILIINDRKKRVTENLFSRSRKPDADISKIQSSYKQKRRECSQLNTSSKNVDINVNSIHNESGLKQKQRRTSTENTVKNLQENSIGSSETELSKNKKFLSYSRVSYDNIVAFDDIFDKTNYVIEDILTPKSKHRKFFATVNRNGSENDSDCLILTTADKRKIEENKYKGCLDFSEKTLNVAEFKKSCTQTDSIKMKNQRVVASKFKSVRQDHKYKKVKQNCSDSDVILFKTPTANDTCKISKRRVKWLI